MKGFFGIFVNAWKVPELRKKLLMTLLLIIIFRIGCFIAVPGLDRTALSQLAGSGLFNFMDVLSGGAMNNVSLFAMGISPYINASIIMQLLTIAIPALERWQKEEGEEGRKKINRITKYLAIGLGLFQAIMLFVNIYNKGQGSSNFGLIVDGPFGWVLAFSLMVLTFTAGTAILMWLGDKITEVGIGNGISMIIFAGILANGRNLAVSVYNFIRAIDPSTGTTSEVYSKIPLVGRIISIVILGIIFLAVIVAVVWMDSGERRIPVQYAKRVVGRKVYGGQNTHIPLKVNSAGVLPIIFAMSVLQFPITIVGMINASGKAYKGLSEFMNTWWYILIYAILIIAFTFFYNMLYFDPVDIANNLKNNGGFVPGLRPGRATSDYIKNASRRITWFGAIFLAILAIFPSVVQKILVLFNEGFSGMSGLWIGGTSVLILVGVAVETVRQLESQLLMRHYKGFLD